MKVSIIYWSGTGNTERMAELIQDGVVEAGNEVVLKRVDEASIDDVNEADIVVLGCPSSGTEELEATEFEPFYDSIVESLKGKRVEIFGSYGWGDGVMQANWKEDLLAHGAVVEKDPLVMLEYPEDEDACIEFGKTL